jgi:hypothetical protein
MANDIAARGTAPGETDVITLAPPRRRRRRLGWVIALGVVVVLAVIGFLVAEQYARTTAEQYIRDQVRTVFALEASQDVAVSIGPGSVLLQAAGGSIDSIDVGVDGVAFGQLTGDLALTATGVPLESTEPLSTLDVSFSIAEDDLQSLTGFLDDINLTSVQLVGDEVEVGSSFDLIGFTFPVTVLLAPSIVDGRLSLSPSTIAIDGNDISVQDLRDSLLGGFAEQILAARSICVAEFIPVALAVTDVTITGDRLVLDLESRDVVLGGDAFTTMGACP